MKKILKVAFVFLLTIFLVGCKSGNVSSISYEKFKEKIDKQESLILLFGDSNVMENTLNNVLNKHDLKAYKVKTSNLSDDEINELRLIVDYKEPSICFIIKGSNPSILTNITDEYVSEAQIENVLKDLEFIK